MKRITLFLTASLLLLSACQNNEQPLPEPYRHSADRFSNHSSEAQDTTAVATPDETVQEKPDTKKQPAPRVTHNSRHFYGRSYYDDDDEEEDDDNMRHFDPCMEDDMDDNGMSRYMEANDEEAWD